MYGVFLLSILWEESHYYNQGWPSTPSAVATGITLSHVIQDMPDEQEDPVLVDMSIALPGAGRAEDVGALLITNQFAKPATPSVLSYKPATPPNDGKVTVIHINDHGVVCCQADSSGRLSSCLQAIMLFIMMTHSNSITKRDGSVTNCC